MEMRNMGDDPSFVHNLDATVSASQDFVKIVCTTACPEHIPAKLTMAIACMTGPLAAISMMTSKGDNVTPDAILFAAILAAMAIAPAGTNALSLTFSPAVLLEAIESFEKLTGQKADSVLCEGMVEAARTVEREGAIPLQSFLDAARKSKLN